MSQILKNMSGIGRPISGIRRTIGCCILVIGIVLSIPSLLMFGFTNNLYEKANVYENTQEFPSLTNSSTLYWAYPTVLEQGHNYDIVVKFSADGPDTLEETGYIEIKYNMTLDGLDNGERFYDYSFNRTKTYTRTFVNDVNFEADKTLSCNFQIVGIFDVDYLTYEVRVYEDPNRPLINTINKIALLLLIPAGIAFVCACCIAPPSKKK